MNIKNNKTKKTTKENETKGYVCVPCSSCMVETPERRRRNDFVGNVGRCIGQVRIIWFGVVLAWCGVVWFGYDGLGGSMVGHGLECPPSEGFGQHSSE